MRIAKLGSLRHYIPRLLIGHVQGTAMRLLFTTACATMAQPALKFHIPPPCREICREILLTKPTSVLCAKCKKLNFFSREKMAQNELLYTSSIAKESTFLQSAKE